MRIAMLQCNMSLYVFNHDDSIVNDKTGSQNDAEQCQRIDREAERFDERERSDERYGNRNGRNYRRAPVKQKEEDDGNNDQNCLFQRRNHFLDRIANNSCRIKSDDVSDSGWERFCQFSQLRLCGLVYLKGVRI